MVTILVSWGLDYSDFDWNGPQATRRSIYRVVWRGIPDPVFDALDFPDLGLRLGLGLCRQGLRLLVSELSSPSGPAQSTTHSGSTQADSNISNS
ncbi:MAG: hypothetical protein ACKPKO_23005 [Candidatus Fonsibacter sp.]